MFLYCGAMRIAAKMSRSGKWRMRGSRRWAPRAPSPFPRLLSGSLHMSARLPHAGPLALLQPPQRFPAFGLLHTRFSLEVSHSCSCKAGSFSFLKSVLPGHHLRSFSNSSTMFFSLSNLFFCLY